MTQAIEKFDPSTLMQGVKARIKATFVSLIPEEQWEAMVQKEIDYFFEQRDQHRNYSTFSDFRKICGEVMTEVSRERIQQCLDACADEIWDSNTNMPKASETLKELLTNEIFTATFGNMFQRVISDMKNRGY